MHRIALVVVAVIVAACHGESSPAPSAPPSPPAAAPIDATTPVDASANVDAPGPAPVEGRCAKAGYHAPAGAALELLAHQVPGPGVVVEVGLHNTGTEPVCVWGRIQTHEVQSDWLTFQIRTGSNVRLIHVDDSRDKSYPVAVELAPGATSWTRWDVAEWAKRARNGSHPLSSGQDTMLAVYDTGLETQVWAGALEASVVVHVP